MIIHEVTFHGARLAPDDDRFQRWVWRDTIVSGLRTVQQGFSDTAQLTTGISADESQLLSLLAQMDAKRSLPATSRRVDADRVMRLVAEYGYTAAQVQRYRDTAEHSRDSVTAAEHTANAKHATAHAEQLLADIRAELTRRAS